MVTFGLADKETGSNILIGIGLTPEESGRLAHGRVVCVSFERLGLTEKLGDGQIMLFFAESDEAVLTELRKRFDIDDSLIRRGAPK